MGKSLLLILKYLANSQRLFFGLILFIFFGCAGSKKISSGEWEITYGHFQGMDQLTCKKKLGGKFLYEYTFEASDPSIEQRTVLIKSFTGNGYVFYWHGVKDTVNFILPKVLRPLRFQPYDHDEKESLKEILEKTDLTILKEKQNYFDSLQYFLLVDSIKLYPGSK